MKNKIYHSMRMKAKPLTNTLWQESEVRKEVNDVQ